MVIARADHPGLRLSGGSGGGSPGIASSHAGASWITDELIAETLALFQPRYRGRLTRADAVAMIERVGRLGEVLERVKKEVR